MAGGFPKAYSRSTVSGYQECPSGRGGAHCIQRKLDELRRINAPRSAMSIFEEESRVERHGATTGRETSESRLSRAIWRPKLLSRISPKTDGARHARRQRGDVRFRNRATHRLVNLKVKCAAPARVH